MADEEHDNPTAPPGDQQPGQDVPAESQAERTDAPAAGENGSPLMHPRADEVFRGLWASLFYSKRATGRSVLICSADRGEGTTTVAAALALAGSTPAGVARVALADLNLRRPALHELLGLQAAPGLAEVATGQLPLDSVVQAVSPGLDLYAAGNVKHRALDVLRSGKLGDLVATLGGAYDNLLIDAAPVNHFPDAQVLAGIVKDVVLVSHSERTPREAVAQAKKRIEAGGGRVVGLVLNLRTFPIPRFLYRRV